jgi:dsRNA-specific ribonuclease
MKAKKQIMALFLEMSEVEQLSLLAELETLIKTNVNAMSDLNMLHQKTYKKNIEKSVWTEGEEHNPTVYCKITLASGKSYQASGKNQKIAGQLAAIKAIKYFK